LKKPGRSKNRRKLAIKRKLEKDFDTLQKAIRMQREAWNLLDGGSRLYNSKGKACIHA
jgi:hypothetical protein